MAHIKAVKGVWREGNRGGKAVKGVVQGLEKALVIQLKGRVTVPEWQRKGGERQCRGTRPHPAGSNGLALTNPSGFSNWAAPAALIATNPR